jgi:hypothetical protein
MEDFIERRVAYLEHHTRHITCTYLVFLLYLKVSLEGTLVKTLLAIYGGIYFIISWSFDMVKTLIFPYPIGNVLLEMVRLLFWGLTTSFLVECSIYLSPCIFIHGVGCLEIQTCGLVACILWTTCYFWRLVMENSPQMNILLFYLSCTLEGALCEIF